MKLIVCAKSAKGHYIGMPSAAGYTVFSTLDADAIQPGDLLSNPVWNDEGGRFPEVRNLTTDEAVRVELRAWSLTLEEATGKLGGAEIVWHPPWPGK